MKTNRDPEVALAECGRSVRDWDGGTRISTALEAFNKRWARRVLTGGAVVLFISDGLERQLDEALPREMARLQRASRRLVWLNRCSASTASRQGLWRARPVAACRRIPPRPLAEQHQGPLRGARCGDGSRGRPETLVERGVIKGQIDACSVRRAA